MPVNSYQDLTTGRQEPQKGTNGAALVSTSNGLGNVDPRIFRFDAAADMPADITSSANVAADRFKIAGISATATKIQFLWHSPAILSDDGTDITGPIAMGARLVIGAAGDTEANDALTYSDLTGGSSSTTANNNGAVMVSKTSPIVEVDIAAGNILRIDGIGIPAGYTPTVILPCFLEVRILG